MGLLSKVTSAVKSVTSSSALNHRKSVLYDFSIVEKAVIKILEAKNHYMQSADEKLDQIDELYVQINPTEFSYEYQTPPHNPSVGVTSKKSKGTDPFRQVVLDEANGSHGQSRIPLVYDIYDEYNIRTSEGLVASEFSLMNETITSLPKLIEYTETTPKYGYFVWGDIRIFGLLESVEVDYRAFSRWGQPLKANVNLGLALQQLPNGDAPKISSLIGSPIKLSDDGQSTQEMLLNVFRSIV